MLSAQKLHPVESLSQFEDQLFKQIDAKSSASYEPTGLQEDVIYSFGCGKFEIILALHPNDVGKTTVGAQIAKNLIWQYDPKWFGWWKDYNIFRDKTFGLKAFRITAQHTNLIETGAIQTEIRRWWPKGQYLWEKGGQHYPSKCETDTGWLGDALSYNQSREEHESKKISFLWSDEPPPPDLLGAMTSRFAEGMLWLITATPIKCGAFLDVIQDMEDAGTKIKRLTGTANHNSVTDGKPNHLGTKKGLRTNEEIASKIARCPKDERDARIDGKPSRKSGKIYPDFDRNKHVKFYDLGKPEVKLWNTFMAIDQHPKYYPFIQWWAYAPEKIFVLYNEWPTYEMFGNFYDDVRNSLICPYNAQDIANFMKIFDGTQYGLQEPERWLDPYCGLGMGAGVNSTEALQMKYLEYGIKLNVPQRHLIEIQREEIRELIKFDPQDPTSDPLMVMMPHCVNSIRMMERHCWSEDEKEDEKFKEGPDDTRNMLAGFAKRGYKKPSTNRAVLTNVNSESLNEYIKNMPSINLG